jgi:uncharacterized protein (TIGR01777 family)
MRVLITGSSGFLGSRLVDRLRGSGHEVVRLVRRAPAGTGEVRWDPAGGTLDPSALAAADAVINLAGAHIGDHRWTERYKKTLLGSRIDATGMLVRTIAAQPADQRPRVLLSSSGVNFYGDSGDRAVDETSPPGAGFLGELSQAWEAAAAPAAEAGVRLVLMRTGLPLGPEGGLLKPLMLPFRLGIGGRLGNGRHWIPWISMPDWLSAVEWLLDRDDVAGPVNLTGPTPVRNSEFTRALARRLHRPALIPIPRPALYVVVGREFVGETLASLRVLPGVLTERGFRFAHRTVDDGLAAALPR